MRRCRAARPTWNIPVFMPRVYHNQARLFGPLFPVGSALANGTRSGACTRPQAFVLRTSDRARSELNGEPPDHELFSTSKYVCSSASSDNGFGACGEGERRRKEEG
jgi:hypothetical protein